jgi:hypothetical protein
MDSVPPQFVRAVIVGIVHPPMTMDIALNGKDPVHKIESWTMNFYEMAERVDSKEDAP